MPLSEDEQRILQEIERSFYENDPAFAKEVRERTLFRHAGRNLKFAGVGFVVGLVVVIAFISQTVVAFAGFLLMLGCAFAFERNLRKLGRAGMQQLQAKKGAGLSDQFGSMSRRMRDRFRRED